MGFGRSLTIDLSLSRLVFLAWCLWPSGWDGETPRAENLLAHPTSFASESWTPGPKPLTLNLNLKS